MRTVRKSARRREQGYALLMVIFLVSLMVIATTAAIPDLLTQGKRQREDEMIWRGEQYERGVKLYFKKKGKYPTEMDDIIKEQDGIHFMRQAYKDPMNTEDGSWRLIYVTPAGQLIGSLNYQTLQQMATLLRPNAPGAGGTAPGGVPGGQPGAPGAFGSSPPLGGTSGNPSGGGFGGDQQGSGSQGTPANGAGGIGQSGAPGVGGIGTATGGTGTGTGTDTGTDEDSNTGPVLGGSITGVGSKIDKPSLKVYQKAVKYKKWEFIWNPLLDVAGGAGGPASGGPAGAPGTGLPGPGQNPGAGGNPQQGIIPNAPPNVPPPGGAL